MSLSPLIALTTLRQTPLQQTPYAWAHVPSTFVDAEIGTQLSGDFPEKGYRHYFRGSGTKRHNLYGMRLIDRHRVAPAHFEAMPLLWKQLAKEVLSAEYRSAISSMTGVSLDGLEVEGTLWRHPEGSFIDPHPDNPGKVVTHLFYFNEQDWTVAHGGCLRILRSSDISDVAAEILPIRGSSVVFIRSETSWHGYTPVQGSGRVRLAFQVIFCRPDMQYSGEANYGS